MLARLKLLLKNLKYISKSDLRKRHMFDLDIEDIFASILYYIPNASILRPDVKDRKETLEILCNTEKSLARFGDGELSIICGKSIPFQEYDALLAKRMIEILKNNNDNLLVGINYWYFHPVFNPNQNKLSFDFSLFHMPKHRKNLMKFIDLSSTYCDAGFTGVRNTHNKENDVFFEKIKTIWNNRNIVLVGCREAHNKLAYNLFENANAENWIYVPNKNAFREYESILSKIKQYPKDYIIILMAGPTSKVLAYDLSSCGYRALDLGHIAKSYDFYVKGTQLTVETEKDFWAPDL